MFHTCRNVGGAAMLAWAALAFAVSAARGGLVVLPAQDAPATTLASHTPLQFEALAELAGLEPVAPPVVNVASSEASASFSSAAFEAFANETTPHATVIPLPAAVWTGAIGLSSLAALSAGKKLRRPR